MAKSISPEEGTRQGADFPGAKPAGGNGDSDGQKSGKVSGATNGITDKFHERPNGHAGKEISQITNSGDGLSK